MNERHRGRGTVITFYTPFLSLPLGSSEKEAAPSRPASGKFSARF